MGNRSPHTHAVTRARDDMQKVIDSFKDEPFMLDSASAKTEKRRDLFSQMSPDLQQLLQGGMPMYMVEKLARADQES